MQSNRYAYWKVALRTFADHPLIGVGSGGFQAEWLRERPFREPVRDAHSLYLETLAELGLVGFALLRAADRQRRRHRPRGRARRARSPPGRCTRARTGTGSCPR